MSKSCFTISLLGVTEIQNPNGSYIDIVKTSKFKV